jgi:hypothetical protein
LALWLLEEVPFPEERITKMTNEEQDCEAKARIDKLAKDALGEIKNIEKHRIPKELELELNEVKKDLDAIIMDDHKHK